MSEQCKVLDEDLAQVIGSDHYGIVSSVHNPGKGSYEAQHGVDHIQFIVMQATILALAGQEVSLDWTKEPLITLGATLLVQPGIKTMNKFKIPNVSLI
jgi:hypothetical protein